MGLVLVLLAAVGVASTASLAVTSRERTTLAATHPCPGTAQVSATTPVNSTAATFAGVAVAAPAACGSRPVQVTVLDGATVVASGAATLGAAGTGTVPVTPTYTASTALSVRATVSGWDLPATWSYVPPATCVLTDGSTAGCTASVTVFNGTKPGGSSSAIYYDVTVTTTSSAFVPWQVTFDFTHPIFNGLVHTRLGNSTLDTFNDGRTAWDGTTNNVARTSSCSAMPESFVVVGTSSGPNNNRFSNVRDDRQRAFSIVVNRTEAGYFDLVAPGCA